MTLCNPSAPGLWHLAVTVTRCHRIQLVQIVSIVSGLSWQVCNQVPSQVYGNIIAGKMGNNNDKAAVGEIVYAAQAIVQNAANKVCPAVGA